MAARKIAQYTADDTGRLFSEPEWKELVAMRGPVEGLEFRLCKGCGSRQPSFMLSGFLDDFSAICDACGAVLFQSVYDDRPLPQCDCGGVFRRDLDRLLEVRTYRRLAGTRIFVSVLRGTLMKAPRRLTSSWTLRSRRRDIVCSIIETPGTCGRLAG